MTTSPDRRTGWFTSSYSNGNGACVEVRMAPAESGDWFKSTYSNGSGACVEVRLAAPAVEVRDTKNRAGGRLQLTDTGWTTLLTGLRQL